MRMLSDPTEIKSVHIKTYVEPSVAKALVKYQEMHNLESVSSAVRQLIITGLDNG